VPTAPTGLVASTDSAFVVGTGATAGPSRVIFSTEDCKILGWHSGLPAAILGNDRSPAGAIYKGLAIADVSGKGRLYATDFHNRRVDVFDQDFQPASGLSQSAFVDPSLPAGYAPFGIQSIDGRLYVTYAQQDAAGEDDVKGPGFGYVNLFETDGKLVRRVASNGSLNAPWGVAKASSRFGLYSDDLLIGNFGDGQIHAYSADSDEDRGVLNDKNGAPIVIDGLRDLKFGNNKLAGDSDSLYFTAGPADESHGLFGRLTVIR